MRGVLSSRIGLVPSVPGLAPASLTVSPFTVSELAADYFALRVLNTRLGEAFTSRLNNNLREVHGYAYGASSRFDMRLSAGAFYAAAGVQTDKTAEALREFFKELNAISQPVPSEELARAKNYLALGFPAYFEPKGYKIVDPGRYQNLTEDFSSQISEFKQAGA